MATSTPWLFENQPAIVAHRGYAGRYPENTLLSLAAAVSYGARFLEYDIQLTRDGVPILCHDETLQRCGGDARRVLDHDWATLHDATVGESARLGGAFDGVHLSSLRDTAAHLASWPRTTSFVEIKEHSTTQYGVAYTVERVLDALRDLPHPYVILSFVDEVITHAKQQGAELTGWVVTNWDETDRQKLTELAPDYVYCNQDKIAVDDALWPGPWHWVLYEVTRTQDAERWRNAGAAMIETMHPPTFITPARR